MADTDHKVVIEVWADLVCPWCYVGEHRLAAALAQRADRDRFEVRVRSFELYPEYPTTVVPLPEAFLATHGGVTRSHFLEMEGKVQALAQAEGLRYEIDRFSSNTFDFHRLVQLANSLGIGHAFFTAIQGGYFSGDLNPFDPEELTAAAEATGMPEARVREVLARDEFADAVRADRAEAAKVGATGVPFTVFDRRFATSGAQSVQSYLAVLEQATAELPVRS